MRKTYENASFDAPQIIQTLTGSGEGDCHQAGTEQDEAGSGLFEHACRLGLEGIVSKRLDASYRSGPSTTWLKSKNPLSEAVGREREEEWS